MSSSSSGRGQRNGQKQQQQTSKTSTSSLNGQLSSDGVYLPSNAGSSSSITREWVENQDLRLVTDMQQQPAPHLHRCRTEGAQFVVGIDEQAFPATASAASLDLATCRSESNTELMNSSGAVAAAATAAAAAAPVTASNSTTVATDYDSSGDRSEKSRSHSRLSSSFSPLYKQRNDMLHRLFKDLPAEERLVTDTSCAWDRSGLLVQGRLYATASRLCFYSKIIGFETRFAVPLTSITSINKERTARVIPNAICVLTASERYFFTSIGSRDRVHSVFHLLWQKACRPEPLDSMLFWELVRDTYGSQQGQVEDDLDPVATSSSGGRRRSSAGAGSAATQDESNDEVAVQATASETGGDDGSGGGGNSSGVGINGEASSTPVVDPLAAEFGLRSRRSNRSDCIGEDTSEASGAQLADPCERHEHFADEYLNVQLSAGVDTVFQCLFAHKSNWFRQFARHRGMTDVCAEPWRPAPPPTTQPPTGAEADAADDSAATVGEWRARRVTFTLPLNNAVGPRSAQQVEEQIYRIADCRPGRSYCVDVTVRSREVPYCDSFHTRARYCLRSHGPNSCRLRVTTDLRFTRSLFKIVRNLIDSSAKKGLADHFSAMRACLIAYLAARGPVGLAAINAARPGDSVGEAGDSGGAAGAASASAGDGVSSDDVDALEADSLVPDLQSAVPPLPAAAAALRRRSAARAGSGRVVLGSLLALCCILLFCFFSLHARCNRLQLLLDKAAPLLPPQQQQQSASSPSASDGQHIHVDDVEQLASALEAALESLEGIRQSLVELRHRILDRRAQTVL